SLEIYDIFGRPVLSSPRLGACPVNKTGGGREGGLDGREGEIRVDVSGLVPGIYLAVVRDKNHWIGSAKFMVVR
ncbi:MAG: T9SS type A sorting domain-containing protein, partial [Bacteroidales bacterium]|nr:T9SS type A sorting domain-containing protein [Bacteroidales bacterium]